MKKVLSLILLALLLMMASMPVQAYDFKSNGLSYNIGDNNTVSVTRGGNYSGDVVIPNSVDYNGNSYSVTSIEENAFNNCNGMTSIIIPNSVMTIGKYAFFACRGLDSVNIPYGVTYIGDNAFSCCDNITNISIPNSVTYIGEYAFWECKFKSISIPSSVRYIGDHVFYQCYNLASLTVDGDNTTYDSRNNCNAIIETATNTLIAGCKNSIIPNGVISVGRCAFAGCRGLKTIKIPQSVINWGVGVFSGCINLESIVVEKGNTVFDSRNNCNAVIKTASNTLVAGCKNTIIPNDINIIDVWAFENISSLTTISIPPSVTTIRWGAFVGCSGITSLTIPNSVTYIGGGAFDGCNMSSVIIPDNVTYLGEYAFQVCKNLTSVRLSKNLKTVGKGVFSGCSGITTIVSDLEYPMEIDKSVFDSNVYATATLTVPTGTKTAYESTEGWKVFQNIVEASAPSSPSTDASITIQTKIFDANSQPPIVGGIIGDYSEESITKKGIIVSVNNNDLLYDAQSEISFPYYYSGKEDKLNYAKDLRIIDCSNAGKEQFWSPLLFLKSGTYYYIRAYVIKKDGSIIYGQTESLRSLSFSRYNGRSDYGNVWHAFDNTLFDLVTDEIINPSNGFYYSTNENPTTVRQQTGTSYNTCYKFATKWNYQLWYYHSAHCVQSKIVDIPLMTFSNDKLYIEKNPADADKDISFYYSINGNFFRPETYTNKYSGPINISESCTVCCYAISSDGYISYTNMYVVASSQVSNNTDNVPGVVDLGLTSGTLWATCNIGASSPEDYGYYFAWGETAPKSNYAWSTYKYGNGSNFTKYNSTDKLTQLKQEDDAAYVILGKDWRMPTHAEELELAQECSWESVTINGISGYKITGPNGNSIFMPKGGIYDGEDYLSSVNTCGWYWSSTLNSVGSAFAQGLCFFSSLLTNVSNHERSDGHNIRPVYVGESNNNNEGGNNEDNTFGKVANAVDLGLSVKWASWNVGASKVGDYGGLYGMGDPTGTNRSTAASDYYYEDGVSLCGTEYDLAHSKWGNQWRLPTKDELKELRDKCTWTHNVKVDEVYGSVATGPNGNTLFLPYAGSRHGEEILERDYRSSIWSGNAGSPVYSFGYMDFDVCNDGILQMDGCRNWVGQSIRPVYVNSSQNASFPDVVDLGLSVKWASWNVGAEKPEGLGNLYAWGELSPKTDYSSSTYKFYNGGYTKYGSVDNKYRLDSEDDIATQAWGDNWRMPTFEELKELKEKCSFTKTELNGVPVTKVVGPNGNFIYFPYPGNYTNKTLYYENSIGSYWSSDLQSDSYAQDIDYISGMPSLNGDTRYHGQAVRPVYGNGASTKCVVNLESAGKLKDKLSNTNSGEILDLKISGYMDARDFDFIKWHCMKVRNVDLSEVKIEAYTGSDGTNEGYNYTYAANEIPLGAFFYWTSSYKYNYEGMPIDEGMPSLKSIKLPSGIKAIRRNAFARAYNLTEINIPEGIEDIDYVSFRFCTSLAELTLPSTLKNVGQWTFTGMTKLRTVVVNAINPPTSSADAFEDVSTDAVLYVPKGSKSAYKTAAGWKSFKTILEIGEAEQIFEVGGVRYIIGDNNEVSVISKDGGYAGDVVIPAEVSYNGTNYTVSAIETDAFDGCNNLQVVILPQAIYNNGIPANVKKFVTYSKNPVRVEVKSKGATSAILNIDPLNEIGNTTVTMLGMTPGQLINWKIDDENYGIISDKTESTLTLEVKPAQPTSTTKARLSAIINEADDDLHYGFEWLRNDAPEGMPSNAVTASLHGGRIVGSLGGLNPDVYYKYRPFYQSDSGKKFYGEWIPFLTGDANVFFEPETHTKEASEITQMSALLAAVWVEGTDDIQEKGFEYWLLPASNTSNTRASSKEVMTVAVSGNKTYATIEGLSASTEYGYRSYAKTASGITYGESLTFKTNIEGDVNDDGYLNEKDVNDLVDHTMGKTPVGFNKKAADLNGDKEVNVADIVKLVNIKNNSSNEFK